jgi:hypothetical protein
MLTFNLVFLTACRHGSAYTSHDTDNLSKEQARDAICDWLEDHQYNAVEVWACLDGAMRHLPRFNDRQSRWVTN